MSSGTVSLFFLSSEGTPGRYLDKANISLSLCARYYVPISKLINTKWVNNFVFSLRSKESVLFGQVTAGNIITYFSKSAFSKPESALGKCLQINLESQGGKRWGANPALYKRPLKIGTVLTKREIDSGDMYCSLTHLLTHLSYYFNDVPWNIKFQELKCYPNKYIL